MPVTFSEEFDVVIVGSGPTGAAYARILTEEAPATRVLLVEAGPAATHPPGHHFANIINDGERRRAQIRSQGPVADQHPPLSEDECRIRQNGGPDYAMLRRPGLFVVGGGPIDGDAFPAGQATCVVGGMGVHWFGACPRPSREERPPYFDGDALDRALGDAEALLRVSGNQFPDSPVAGPLRAALEELFGEGRSPDRAIQPMPMALVRTETALWRSGPAVILGRLVTDPPETFELRSETVCLKILMDKGRAIGVTIKNVATGKARNAAAKHVVVAADSLHTPQLLYASGIRPSALGRYLNEHPQVGLYCEFDAGGQALDSPLDFAGGILSDRTAFSRLASGVTWIPYDGDSFPFHVQISEVKPRSLGDPYILTTDKPVLSVAFFLPSEIQAENHVSFSGTETDWLGRPKMSIRFKLSERDLRHLELARQTLLRICNRLGRPLRGHSPRTPPNGSSLHYQGTVRMGAADDGTSVCDNTCRVWGTENVYVAGNGVIPTETASNPTLTSVALAILGARDIASRLRRGAAAPATLEPA